jgi:pyruvate formate lyase activating enzyme
MRYLEEFEDCQLCEWKCRVNRLKGETGVCKVTLPGIASAMIHPAPPESYTIFMAGCNYKCLNCQNWSISQYPDNKSKIKGYLEPGQLARECINQLNSPAAKLMGADRAFFSGGEPTIHLPFIEKVVEEARKINPSFKVNYDTNGFLTKQSLKRVLEFTTSITYDLKAYHDEVHRTLTGASVKPVLRNAEIVGRQVKEKLWEYRILVIPGINEEEIRPLSEFIASIDPHLPVCFLAFRPNFVLENHPGASHHLMEKCLRIARQTGLKNVHWSGHPDLPGKMKPVRRKIEDRYSLKEAKLAGSYAASVGCITHPRDCGSCRSNQACPIKKYPPTRVT